MAHSSPARWLAPVALVAGVLALVVVLATSGGSSSSSPDSSPTAPAQKRSKQAPRKAATRPATTPVNDSQQHTYTVQAGDYLSTVSEKTGVSVERLRELNPGLDANSMSVGQEIRLAPGKP